MQVRHPGFQKPGSMLGKDDATRRAMEQFQAQRFFQAAHLEAHIGLWSIQLLCRSREPSGFGNCCKHQKIVQVRRLRHIQFLVNNVWFLITMNY